MAQPTLSVFAHTSLTKNTQVIEINEETGKCTQIGGLQKSTFQLALSPLMEPFTLRIVSPYLKVNDETDWKP